MAKIETGTEFKRVVPPTARYKGRLTKVVSKTVKTAFGMSDRFFWIFELSQYQKATKDKAGKITRNWVDAPYADPEKQIPLTVVKSTNRKHKVQNGSFTPFVQMLIQDQTDTFMETVADTDALIGWSGEIVVVQETAESGNKYADIKALVPDDEWFDSWVNNMTGDAELLAKNAKDQKEGKSPAGNSGSAGYDIDSMADPFDE